MCCHGHQRDEIPECIWVFQVCNRVSLLGVDEIWEQDRIPDEEDRSVVANNIPVSLFSVELDCKSSWVPCSIC